jgi:hypothetical protein
MKLVNFASFDPTHQKRNVKGLANASNLDRTLWEEFEAAPNRIAEQSEKEFNRLAIQRKNRSAESLICPKDQQKNH